MVLKTVIIGASGHGRVVLDILANNNEVEVVGFVDDDPELKGEKIDDVFVLGDISSLKQMIGREVDAGIVAIGDNKIRARIFIEMSNAGLKMINAIHPNAIIAQKTTIGIGNMIAANTVINPGTTIGNNCIVNTGANIDHDNHIADHVHISPGANLAGIVSVGNYSHVGIGATIINCVNIGRNITVGAGAVVINEIPDNVVIAGVPAKIINLNKS